MDEFEEMHDYQGTALAFLQTFSPQDLAQPAPAEPLFVPSETDAPAPSKPKYTEDQLKLMPEWIETSKKMFEVMNDGQRFIGSDKQAASYGLDLMSEFNWNMAGPAGIPGESGISVPGFGVQVYNLMSESAGPDAANGFLNMLDIYADTKTEGATIKRAFRGLAADPLTYATPVGSLYSLGAKAMARKTATTGLRNMLMSTAKAAGYVGEKAVTAPGKTGMAAGAGYGMGFEGGLMGVETAAGDQPTLAEAATRLAVSGTVGSAVGGTLGKVIGGTVAEAAPAIVRGVDELGQAAEARMAERGPITDRVMSGADPMEVIDPVLAAAGKLVRPTKENPVTAVPPTETEPGIIAFHGSGADFDQFSLEKIGTGEGAQAYGYGLYFTDSEDIAKFYKESVSGGPGMKKLDYDSDTQASKSIPDIEYEDVDGYRSYSIDKARDIIKSALKMQRFNVEPDDNALNIFEMTFERDGALQIDMRDGTSVSLLKNFEGDAFTVTPLGKKEEGKTYKVGLEPKPEELLDYDKPIGEQPEEIKVALIKALEDINDPELNTKITLEARAAKEKQEAVASLNKELDDFSDNLPNQKSKETFAKLRELLIDKKHKWSAMVNKADMEEERKLFEEFTKAVPPSKYPDIDPNIIYDIQRSLKIASPKSIGSFLPTDKKTADALSNAGIKGIKYRAAVSRSADVDDAAAERNYVIFDDKAIKILEKYGIVGPVAITALGAAKQEGADNGNT